MTDDPLIDNAIRSVDVPTGLRGRLRPESLFDDSEIDRLLGNVAVPANLTDSIRAAVRAGPAGRRKSAIEPSRGPAPAPKDGAGGMFIGRRAASDWGLRPFASDIASVVTAVSLVIMLAVASIEFSRRLEGTVPARRTVTRLHFEQPSDTGVEDAPIKLDAGNLPWSRPERQVAAPSTPGVPSGAFETEATDGADHLAKPGSETNIAARPSLPETYRGAVPSLTPLPTMMTVDFPGTARRRVPRSRGYDLPFEMATGEQPFIDPAVDPFLATDRPPLVLRTHGFELLTAAGSNRLALIRSEEVLSALPPASTGSAKPGAVRIGIHEVRGLRAIGTARTVLVEVAATAGPLPRVDRPVETTLVLDQSAAGEPAVWRRICRALAALAEQLDDRAMISVVLSGPRSRTVLKAGGRREVADLATDLEWQPASASADLEGGLELAAPASRVVVVAHASTLETAGGGVRAPVAAWHKALSQNGGDTLACQPDGGTRFIIIDSTPASTIASGAPLAGLTSPDAVAIRRELTGQTLGRHTLVAKDCGFDVRFDPRRVAWYRLIGHRQSAVESLAETSPRTTDLHAGETVRVVYEVVPRTPDVLPGLASAAINWTSPGGTRESLEAVPNRSSADLGLGLPSPHGCELLLAAGLSELAGASAHTGPRPALTTALDQLVAQWRTRGDVTVTGDALARSHERRRPGFRKPSY